MALPADKGAFINDLDYWIALKLCQGPCPSDSGIVPVSREVFPVVCGAKGGIGFDGKAGFCFNILFLRPLELFI
jgi:hypothetical protein